MKPIHRQVLKPGGPSFRPSGSDFKEGISQGEERGMNRTGQFLSKLIFGILLTTSVTSLGDSLVEPCESWSANEAFQSLPAEHFPEVSGMRSSKKFADRLYLVNDSGDGANFYSFDQISGNFEKVQIKGFKGWDMEAMGYGPCGSKNCIYVADIGDNQARRKIIRIAGIVEKESYGSQVTPLFHKILKYPDGGKDAEAIIVAPDGYLYIFSKEFGLLSSDPTRVYRISLKRLQSSSQDVLEKVGTFKWSSFLSPLTVTDAAVSPNGKRLFLLGYFFSLELNLKDFLDSLSPDKITDLENAVKVSTGKGSQTEAVTYSSDGNSVIWTYESSRSDPNLIRKTCFH